MCAKQFYHLTVVLAVGASELLLRSAAAPAQGLAYLVKDINVQPVVVSSDPGPFVEVGGRTVFAAYTPSTGRELWTTDGTAAGTLLVEDIYPGAADSAPSEFATVDGTLLFVADDGAHGAELWTTDGTTAGTMLFKDINPGAASSAPRGFTDIDGVLFFVANDGTHGAELWMSDGTQAGTQIVADINPGAAGSSPSLITSVSGSLFFFADDGSQQMQLWRSDGTAAGTVAVSDLFLPTSVIAVNDRLFFATFAELWASNGTAAGTRQLLHLSGCSPSASLRDFTELNGSLFFSVADYCHESALWRSDGTEAGTELVKGFGFNGIPDNLTAVNGTLFFTVSNIELWKSDGSEAGTELVTTIDYPGFLENVNGTLFFTAGGQLWKSNGTGAGTVPVTDIDPSFLAALSGTRFFAAGDVAHGTELWTSDGTRGGTLFVKNIAPDDAVTGSASPSFLTEADGTLFFYADDGIYGRELWKSDGTSTGTVLVRDIRPGSAGSYSFVDSQSAELTSVNGVLFFAADDGMHGYELWKSDGSASGTALVKDILPGAAGSYPFGLANVDGTLFFSATAGDGLHGQSLWKSDGTEAGTMLVKDIWPYGDLIGVGATLFFSAFDDAHGLELWKSDGTEAGTALVKDIIPGPIGSLPAAFTDINGTLFFRAGDGLWKSDGSEVGTVLLRTVAATDLTNVNGTLFFAAPATGATRTSLWKSDGTAAGTLLVADSSPSYLTNVGGTLFFFTRDDAAGDWMLWKSDGSAAGIVPVKDIAPSSTSSYLSSLVSVPGRLLFEFCGADACQVWESNGTATGTRRLADFGPSRDFQPPGPFAAVGSLALFAANDPLRGRELWALPLAAITVNSTADNTTAGDGECTLREAIANVNAAGDTTGGDCSAGTGRGDTIGFDLTLPATITLTITSELAIHNDMEILGPTTGVLAVDGSHATRVLEVMGGTVHMANLTVQNGYDDIGGGGILIDEGATLTLTNSTVSGNRGGILNGGTLTLTGCALTGNSIQYGGGIYNAPGGTATLTNCTLSDNFAAQGSGGGMYIAAGSSATLTNCTLSRNDAEYGVGGMDNSGTATLTNCTLNANSGPGGRGGLLNTGTATLTNTIVANSPHGDCTLVAPIVDGGHNLSDDTCFASPGFASTDLRLAPLANYGGPTATVALCTGLGIPDPSCSGPSPAIDAGDDAVTEPPLSLPSDQRGLPRKSGIHVDIGAYEVQQVNAPPACIGDCSGTSTVGINDLITLVKIALGNTQPAACPHGVPRGVDVTVAVIIQAMNNALNPCAIP